MEIDKIILELRQLDLSTYPKEEIKNLMKLVGGIGVIAVHFKHGTPIMRGRPNEPNERFKTKSDYSFKPQQFNTTYQRASTPHQTMFYGVVPNTSNLFKITDTELAEMRRACFAEIFYKGLNIEMTPKISFGRWQVKENKQLNLIAIVQEDKFKNSNIFIEELNNAYQKFISQLQDDSLKEKSLQYTKFLANEFSNNEIVEDYDYMITAIYSEFVSKQKRFDGILYPSVRIDGNYFNIAISPEIVDEKLELLTVAECPITKTNDGYKVEKSCAYIHLKDNEESFELIDQ